MKKPFIPDVLPIKDLDFTNLNDINFDAIEIIKKTFIFDVKNMAHCLE